MLFQNMNKLGFPHDNTVAGAGCDDSGNFAIHLSIINERGQKSVKNRMNALDFVQNVTIC